MKISELFVNIGVKGAEETTRALKGVSSGFKEITSQVFYAYESVKAAQAAFKAFVDNSNHAGVALTQFGNLTGLSTDKLQRWQYLMRQSGVSVEETTSNIESLQKAIADVVLNKGNPEGMTAVANVLGKSFDPSKMRDTFYMLDKLREYAQKTQNIPDVSNRILQSFGISDGAIQALRSSSVDLSKIAPSNLYSQREQKALNAMGVAWSNLANQIDKAIGRLNVRFGPSLLKDLTLLTTQMLKLVEAFALLIDKLHVIKGISKVADVASGALHVGANAVGNIRTKGGLVSGLSASSDDMRKFLYGMFGAPPGAAGSKEPSANVEINTTVHVGDTHNAAVLGAEISSHISRHINDAFRQLPQGGGQ